MILSERIFFSLPDIATVLDGKLSKPQEKSMDILTKMASNLATFPMAVLGALSFYIKKSSDENGSFSSSQLVLILLSAGLALISIYFGQLTSSFIVEMLSNDILNLLDASIVWSVRLQSITLIAAVVCLLWFVVEKHL